MEFLLQLPPPISFFIVDRKSTRLNSSHSQISYAVFSLKKKTNNQLHSKTALYMLDRRLDTALPIDRTFSYIEAESELPCGPEASRRTLYCRLVLDDAV